MKRGFTLVELLVAVLIIGVLTAMALPMYQKSVDKSRYATLMPLAKNIKDAQEAFYLGGGKYSKDLGSLDVRVPGNPSGATATLSDGTTVEISTTDGYGYVKLSKNNLNNNYIIYQDRSQNYPGEIHCEALTDSDRAQELCQNLGGTQISGSLTDGYTTYILSGTGAGIAPDLNQEAENHGNWQSCDTYPCTKACDRTVKTGYDCNGTYNEDGTYSEKVCQEYACITTQYDEDGKRISRYVEAVCDTPDDGSFNWSYRCKQNRMQVFDKDGNLVLDGNQLYDYDTEGRLTAHRYCYEVSSDYTCAEAGDPIETYTYNDDGTLARESGWTIQEYSYDNGKLTSVQWCGSYEIEGSSCGAQAKPRTAYNYDGDQLVSEIGFQDSTGEEHTRKLYDADGKLIALQYCGGTENGTCTNWNNYGYQYIYDSDGKIVQERACSGFNADYSCADETQYSTINYVYDENGARVYKYSPCGTYDSNGQCMAYNYEYNCLERECM